MHRIFLLSPAYAGGKRAQLVLNPRAEFALARRLRTEGVPLGELFSFLSGLYFRGKLAYAKAFAAPPANLPAGFVITPNRGLLELDCAITLKELRAFGRIPIDEDDPRYTKPLRRDASRVAAALTAQCQVVLLGSISTPKYVDLLLNIFGEQLHFPGDFVGRGDMSRGGLMLRSVANRQELSYAPVAGAVRHGKRPPKLIPIADRRMSI